MDNRRRRSDIKKSKTRRRNENSKPNYEQTQKANQFSNKQEAIDTNKKSIFAPIFLIITIITIFLYKFLGITLVTIIALIPFIYYIVNKRNAKRNKKRAKGTMFILLLYLLIIGIGIRANGVLNSLTMSSEVNQFYVIALKDDEVSNLDQIEAGETIGLGPDGSYEMNTYPKQVFSDEGYDFRYTTYQSSTELATSLLDGSIRFIVVDDIKSDELKQVEGFSKQTKVIAKYKEKIKIKSSGKNVKKNTFNILLTGVDTRVDSIDTQSRSDSIMVARVNPRTAKVRLVSIPRDTYILSSCTGSYDKITHSSLNGINCLIEDVENLLDIKIDFFLTVNFFAVIDAIDAVGGIDVEVETAFCGQDEYDNPNAYCFTPGSMHLDGAQALSYARERHAFSGGDYARAEHQQQVISGFTSALIKSGPFVINDLLEVASQSARTNLSPAQMTDLIKLLQKKKTFEIETYTLSGYGMSVDIPYWGLYGTSVQNIDDSSLVEAKTFLNSI